MVRREDDGEVEYRGFENNEDRNSEGVMLRMILTSLRPRFGFLEGV